jgi:alkylated DNA repair dioxygenase AlkB
LPARAIRQVLVTEYQAGAGIDWHRDKPHFEEVFGLSLLWLAGSGFAAGRKAAGSVIRSAPSPAALYLMTGESRHVWEHSIPPWSSFAIR